MRNSKFTLISALSLFTFCIGCNNGFQAQNSKSDFTPSYASNNENLQDYLADLEATPLASSEPQDIQTSVNRVEFLANLDINFGNISRIMGQTLESSRKSIWPNCSKEQMLAPDYKRQYNCGELPIGDVMDSETKLLMTLPVDGESGRKDSTEYAYYGINIPLYLDRIQKKGLDKIDDLTTKSFKDIEISDQILDNFYVRLSPDSGDLTMDICFFSPGIKVYSGDNHIFAKANRRLLFLNLKVSADVNIDPGSMSFDKAKFCTSFTARVVDNETKVTINEIKEPVLTNFKHSGLKVHVDFEAYGILGVALDVARAIGFNIERKIETKLRSGIYNALEKKAQNFVANKVKSGGWFKRYLESEAFDKIAKKIEQDLARINNSYGPGAVNNINVWYENGCRSLAKKFGSELGGLFDSLCRQSFEIQAHLFEADEESKKMGCYDFYFQPQKPGTPLTEWWARNCRIESKLSIRTPEELAPLYACITKFINTDPSQLNQEDQPCAYELSLLVEDTDRERILEMRDLASQIKEKRRELSSPNFGAINKVDFFNMVYDSNF